MSGESVSSAAAEPLVAEAGGRWWDGMTAFDAAAHIARCLDSLLAGVEDEETLEECQSAAAVWMRDLASIAALTSETALQRSTPNSGSSPGGATDGQRQGWLEELAGEWTPQRVLYLARASEITALCEALNDLPALLARVEAAERERDAYKRGAAVLGESLRSAFEASRALLRGSRDAPPAPLDTPAKEDAGG